MAWHRTGTATITQGSDTVAGVGVNWMRQHVGWIMVTAASGTLHEIKEIISSTDVRLAAPVADASASGLGYFIIPTHALNADLIASINQMITQFETSREAWQAVYQDFSAGPYQLWLDQGNAGTVGDFLTDIKGDKGDKGDVGDTGASAYAIWIAAGNSGDEDAFLDWFTQQALTQAGAARDAAQTAQGGAETARDAAQGSASQVASDLAAVAAIFDSFDDRYLGSKASDPLTDNDGDPLQTGAVYWNSVEGETRFYHSGNWERPSASAATSAQQAVDAKLAALAAQAAAETAQGAAETARDAAELAETGAETAKGAAVVAQGVAETAASNAGLAEAGAAAAYDDFDDRYLGPKGADPTLDNDGDALTVGALYFNTTGDVMRVYNSGLTWQDTALSAVGLLQANNNLSDVVDAPTARTNLGLGDAATKTVQSSPTDTTAGRVMLNRAHGLGGTAVSATNNDCNDLTASGFYYFDTATANRPTFTTNGLIIHTARTDTIHTQLAISRAAGSLGRFAIRAKVPFDGWSEWYEGYTQASILGTVSQSGGVPTGALIQSGSNANGSYTRFADGTQICTHTLSSSASTDVTWTFPAAFVTASSVAPSITPSAPSPQALSPSVSAYNGVSLDFSVYNSSDLPKAIYCRLNAIGRWF
jgi:hypothetical protein